MSPLCLAWLVGWKLVLDCYCFGFLGFGRRVGSNIVEQLFAIRFNVALTMMMVVDAVRWPINRFGTCSTGWFDGEHENYTVKYARV